MKSRSPQVSAGFTLLELSISIAVLAILAIGIFSLAAGSAEMMDELRLMQDREARKRRFVELCRDNFESLPAAGRIEFEFLDRGGHYDSHLSFVDAPGAFGFGAARPDLKRVILATELESGGRLRAVLYYLNAEQDAQYDRQGLEALRLQPVPLLRRLKQLTWRYFDKQTRQWRETQRDTDAPPALVEMTLAFEDDAEPLRSVFWAPVRHFPEPGEDPTDPTDPTKPTDPAKPADPGTPEAPEAPQEPNS
jgi:prepilin-type N-terminal cleavage/methylation domain-containing protein